MGWIDHPQSSGLIHGFHAGDVNVARLQQDHGSLTQTVFLGAGRVLLRETRHIMRIAGE
jgi:hypothetical protein